MRAKNDPHGSTEQMLWITPVNLAMETCQHLRDYHDYGLNINMEIGSPSTSMQSVKQEYQAYITGMQSAPTVDILKFWEVCI